ncbi:MAG: hypothetical protein HKN50_10225 [Gammaproteobacteria bacterium]|nr:hypothetical protein [Gammaproteobacteria bacterium]
MTAIARPELGELSQLAAQYCRPQASPAATPADFAPSELIRQLDYHGITLLALHHNALPGALATALESRKSMMAANEMLKQAALKELFECFSAAGLERVILFKGTALAYSVYEQPWLRPRSDADCLIDVMQRPEFEACFEQLGYQKLFAMEAELVHYQATYSKALGHGSALNIDLHWQISNRHLLARAFNVDQLLVHANRLPKLSDGIAVPCSTDSLIIAALHRLGHHPGEERLIWLYDIHLLAQSLRSDDWHRLEARVTRKKIAALTLDSLKMSQQLFETPIPESVIERLEKAASKPEPSRLFLQRELKEWQYFWRDLKGLDRAVDRCRAVWQNLFPPADYVRRQMNTRFALWGYLKRGARGCKRVFTG